MCYFCPNFKINIVGVPQGKKTPCGILYWKTFASKYLPMGQYTLYMFFCNSSVLDPNPLGTVKFRSRRTGSVID